jgi:hypothetical protein
MVAESSNTEDAGRRARMLVAIRAELALQARDLSITVTNVDLDKNRQYRVELPNNRLSGIANGFAWHTQRRTATERLGYGMAEIARLQKRIDRNSAEHAIYTWLSHQIGKDARPSDAEQILLDDLQIEIDQEQEWLARMRLVRAQNLVELLRILTQARPFTVELTQAGGALRWF